MFGTSGVKDRGSKCPSKLVAYDSEISHEFGTKFSKSGVTVRANDFAATGSRTDILHISEAYGGGVQSAVFRYIEHSPELNHRILVRVRVGHDIEEECPAHLTRYNGSIVAFLLFARSLILETKPGAVHLHSSFAGLLRAFPLQGIKVIYTPHAYAFLRRDQSLAARAMYWIAESILSKRAQTIAAISPFEVAVAAKLSSAPTRVSYLPNVVSDEVGNLQQTVREGVTPVVVTVGRVSAQKDPLFFSKVARATRLDIQWVWVGDGDSLLKNELERAGVQVTGWMPNEKVHNEIARADLYFHSSEWEGAPITLLEAAAIGTPVLARGIETLTGLGFQLTDDCPIAAAQAIERFFGDDEYGRQIRQATLDSVEVHSPQVQASVLKSLYGRAI